MALISSKEIHKIDVDKINNSRIRKIINFIKFRDDHNCLTAGIEFPLRHDEEDMLRKMGFRLETRPANNHTIVSWTDYLDIEPTSPIDDLPTAKENREVIRKNSEKLVAEAIKTAISRGEYKVRVDSSIISDEILNNLTLKGYSVLKEPRGMSTVISWEE